MAEQKKSRPEPREENIDLFADIGDPIRASRQVDDDELSDDQPLALTVSGPDVDEKPLTLDAPAAAEEEEGDRVSFSPGSRIGGFSGQAAVTERKSAFKRPMNMTGTGATRVKLFHCKIAAKSMENMEDSINDWLDDNEIEVKQVGHVIGTLEGKKPEPNVIVMIWH